MSVAKVAGYTAVGVVGFGAVVYGRLYFDVLMAESAVRAIDREIKATETERQNLQHEIASNRKTLVELEAKGTAQLKEQTALRRRVDETTSLLAKLKEELLQSKTDFEKIQARVKETSSRIDRLNLASTERVKAIEMADARRQKAREDVLAAQKSLEPSKLPVMGPLLFKQNPK